MRIYLDDCSDDNRLIRELEANGHEVLTPRTEGTRGADDEDHFRHAVEHQSVLLTKNPQDFVNLHNLSVALGNSHQGILLVYQDNTDKDMTARETAEAVGNLINSGIPIGNETHNLNHWR